MVHPSILVLRCLLLGLSPATVLALPQNTASQTDSQTTTLLVTTTVSNTPYTITFGPSTVSEATEVVGVLNCGRMVTELIVDRLSPRLPRQGPQMSRPVVQSGGFWEPSRQGWRVYQNLCLLRRRPSRPRSQPLQRTRTIQMSQSNAPARLTRSAR